MRYINQKVFKNARDAYKRYLKTRGMKLIHQYDTPKFKYPSDIDASNFTTIKHIWTTGDRYFKLADKYYDDPEMWWVIAFYNQKPTEFHAKLGDVIYIPIPLETILFYIGY
jgi:nucleoid-associated protein YgaU